MSAVKKQKRGVDRVLGLWALSRVFGEDSLRKDLKEGGMSQREYKRGQRFHEAFRTLFHGVPGSLEEFEPGK